MVFTLLISDFLKLLEREQESVCIPVFARDYLVLLDVDINLVCLIVMQWCTSTCHV